MGSEMTLFEWGREIVTPVGDKLNIESAREGAILKTIEMLHSGVTYVNDMFVHSNPKTMASLGVVLSVLMLCVRAILQRLLLRRRACCTLANGCSSQRLACGAPPMGAGTCTQTS